MTFREMTVEDLEQVVEIENRLFSDPWTKEGFFTFLTKENTMFFVIDEKEKILAYCSMQTVLDEGDILNVAVSPDRQREGIGYFLVDSMLKMAEMIGIHIVHLEVREGNGTARRLYERLGFKEDGLRKNYYTDPTENAVLMTKMQSAIVSEGASSLHFQANINPTYIFTPAFSSLKPHLSILVRLLFIK